MYKSSREQSDRKRTNLLRDKAFNRHSMNDGHHRSPLDNGTIQVGDDGIVVKLTQSIDEEAFKRTLSSAVNATIGVDLNKESAGGDDDWEEMLKGGLQTALESQIIVFEVSGVSRTCTHQLVRSRRAAFHQQSQRASWMGEAPEVRIPESVWLNPRARDAFIHAAEVAARAYNIACEENISYQDARYCLLEGTDNYIMCEYSVREFLAVYAYRACSMFSWEIVTVVRKMGALLVAEHPWMEPYVKISCEKTHGSKDDHQLNDRRLGQANAHTCTFQGWERVDGQCDLPWARDTNRQFQPDAHVIADHSGLPRYCRNPACPRYGLPSDSALKTCITCDGPVGVTPLPLRAAKESQR